MCIGHAQVANIRWEMLDGTYFVKLIAGKTRVTPKMKVTIPRVELLGAAIAGKENLRNFPV